MVKRGFTLIELLVVILVIGILIAIFIPIIAKARERGYISGCANNMRQIGYALNIYADDHDGRYPPGHAKVGADYKKDDLSPLYPGYVDDFNVFMCPAAKAKLPKERWVSSEEQLTRSRTDTEIGIDYEYRGRQEPEWEMPSTVRADKTPTTYVLLYDNDNRGEPTGEEYYFQMIDMYDNHGAAGGNKLFSDGSIRWYPADKWAYPLEDGTDWSR